MAQEELIMPKMGESVAEATIIKWLKEEGEKVELEEPVLEIATDKVDSEVPSPVEGMLVKCLFNEDDVVSVGQAIALIETDGAGGEQVPASATEAPVREVTAAKAAEERVQEAISTAALPRNAESERFYSPLVRKYGAKRRHQFPGNWSGSPELVSMAA